MKTTVQFEYKINNSLVEIKEVNEKDSTAVFVFSDDTKDRMDDVVLPSAFNVDEFMKHPVLVANHNAHESLLSNIGKILDIDIKATKAIAKGQWFTSEGNPEADFGFKLMQKGIGAFSHKFLPILMSIGDEIGADDSIPLKIRKKNPFRVFKKVDLMEISQVVLPANRNALQKYLQEGFEGMIEPIMAKSIIENNLLFDDLTPFNKAVIEEVMNRLGLIEKQLIDLRNTVNIDSKVLEQIDKQSAKTFREKISKIFDLLDEKKKGQLKLAQEKINAIIDSTNTVPIKDQIKYIKEILKIN